MSNPKKQTPALNCLTLADIMQADDCPMKEVHVPEWGGVVFIKTMTGPERADYDRINLEATNFQNDRVISIDYAKVRMEILRVTICDAQGNPIFKDEAAVNVLKSKSGAVLDRLCEIAAEHNRLNSKDTEEAKKK